MLRSSASRYQVVTTALTLLVGSVVGAVAIGLWEGMILDEEERHRETVTATLALLGERSITSDSVRLEAALTQRLADPKSNIHRVEFLAADGTLLAGNTSSARRPSLVRSVASFRDGSGAPGEVRVDFDSSEVDGKVNRVVLHVLGLVGTLAIVNFLTVGWLARRWMAPLAALSKTMEEVQKGDLTATLPEEGASTITEVSRHFNGMLKAIRDARQQTLMVARRQANIEKFAALGRLSAGVAHEINNPVGGLLTCIAVLKDEDPASDRFPEYLEMMKEGLEKIARIVTQLLRFARQPHAFRQMVSLNEMLEEVLHLARFQYRNARLHVVWHQGLLPPAYGSPDLLSQLFLNLVMNALQAMPDGGILSITTAEADDAVTVAIEDTGSGIPEDQLERIFEPFFTTKEVGEGTGLGLSVALGIVEAHGGSISASNRPEGGARFQVRLPIDVPSGREKSTREIPL